MSPPTGRAPPAAAPAVSGSASSRRCSDIPIELTAVEEGSAYGAALLGGVAGGLYADVHDAVARCVRVRETVEPDPAWQAAYDEAYPRFRALYPALENVKERAR